MAPLPGAGQETTPSQAGVVLATRRTDAAKLIWVKVLKEWVAALEKEVRPLAEGAMEPGEQVTAVMPDNTRVGKVSLSEAPNNVVVTDEAALIAWVQKNKPTEIVPSLREAYWNTLKNQVKTNGHAFDPDTGEIIPGIEAVAGTPRLTPTPNDEGRRLVMAFLTDMSTRSVVLALPSAERPAA